MQSVNPYFCVFPQELPSYEEFYNNVMKKNIVCLINEQLTINWLSRQNWTKNGTDVNVEFFQQNYGNHMCPVYNCNQKYFNSNPKESMALNVFLNYMKSVKEQNYDYGEKKDILYLKDWHFFQDTSQTDVYTVPQYFESDYLNEYCLQNSLTDYRFVYMGPKLSSTPLHVDVFGSFSWSANICGLKKWLIIPQKNVAKLKKLLPELPNDLYAVQGHEEIFKKVEAFEITQRAGETLFVPSGYFHQVVNLEDTISINHNWFNACNLERIFENILEAHEQVQKEIGDLKESSSAQDWHDNCQKILAMHFGLNLNDFLRIILQIVNRLERESKQSLANKFRFDHDVESILSVSSKIRSNDHFIWGWNKVDEVVKKLQCIKYKKLAKLL